MTRDRHPRTTGRRRASRRVLGAALVVAAVLGTGGCLFAEPEASELTITNGSDAALSVFVQGSTRPRTSVDANGTRRMVLPGHEGDCIEWLLEARTTEGTAASTLGPPVCDKDEWVITQEDVDAAATPE